MKYVYLLILFFCLTLSAQATHIVGGEFQLSYTNGTSYELTLNLYVDKLKGNPGAIDNSIRVSIFTKNTNLRVLDVMMPLVSRSPVNYSFIACTNPELSTEKVVYKLNLNLPENLYANQGGYYVVYERCCRNNSIDNIINPQDAGQTFYLEFPAVVRNGVRFINSSPELFPPLSDYACVNDLFYYDFGGVDPDGDSLVYEMTTPFNGYSAPFPNDLVAPWALPAPYPLVNWINGLSTANQIPGSPAASINRNTGRFTVKPTLTGLFVFAVKCSEYRNGQKIGEVRRDFQLLVLNCPKNAPPAIRIRQAGKKTFYREGDIIKITNKDSRCLEIYSSDTDPDESLTIETKPVNFTLTDPLVALQTGIVNQNGNIDSLKTVACFPECLNSEGKVYLLDLIVRDDGCSLPKRDTVRVSFQIEPLPNADPLITTTANAVSFRPKLGEVLAFDVIGTDADNDLISLSVTGVDFNVNAQTLTFPANAAPGQVISPFTWKIDCNAINQALYTLKFTATTRVCGEIITKDTFIEVRPEYQNNKPTITTDMAGKTIDILFGTTFTDTIFGTDPDLDLIALAAEGEDFNLAEVGMKFTPGSGNGQAKALFTWQPACEVVSKNQYRVNFILTESTCKPFPPQTLTVTFNITYSAPATFIPANIFTPNNDGLNDVFVMPTLPPDFCTSVFSRIKIYNRWGGLVYESQDRNFAWDGKDVTDGVFYYHIYYTNKKYTGTVTLVR